MLFEVAPFDQEYVYGAFPGLFTVSVMGAPPGQVIANDGLITVNGAAIMEKVFMMGVLLPVPFAATSVIDLVPEPETCKEGFCPVKTVVGPVTV